MHLAIGLGNMGLAMARNLQEFLEKEQSSGSYSPSFHVWNRTQSKAQPLLDHGASLAPSISGDSIASFACTRCSDTGKRPLSSCPLYVTPLDSASDCHCYAASDLDSTPLSMLEHSCVGLGLASVFLPDSMSCYALSVTFSGLRTLSQILPRSAP